MEKGARAVTSQNPFLHAPASCRVPGARGSFGSVCWGRLLGASRGSSVSSTSGLPPSLGLQDRTLSRVPRRASPPPRHPEPPCALHTGSFRLGSPRSPCHPLGSPRSSALPTHTHPRFVEVPPLGSLLAKSFSFSKVPLLPSPGLPDPSAPLGPLPLLDPAGTVPRLEGRIPSWALGVCLGWSSWEDRPGVWGPCPVHPDRPEGQI